MWWTGGEDTSDNYSEMRLRSLIFSSKYQQATMLIVMELADLVKKVTVISSSEKS